MNAGAYTQRIAIEKLVRGYDEIGNPVENWGLTRKCMHT